jgi:hypothetical protein
MRRSSGVVLWDYTSTSLRCPAPRIMFADFTVSVSAVSYSESLALKMLSPNYKLRDKH